MENNNKGLSQDQIARLQKLAGIKTNLTESEDSKGIPTSTLDNATVRVGVDGVKYGIVKENANYFIKKSTSTSQNLTESDFVFLGGIANKNKYKYPSHGDALKNLNMMMITLNESFNITETKKEDTEKKEEVKEVEGSTTAKDFKVDGPEKVAFKEEEEVTDITTDVEPVAEPAADEVSTEVSAEPTAEVPAETTTDDNTDTELDAEDPVKEIQSMVGKLTNKIRNTELTEDATKSVLNSVIAALNLKLISDDDRLAIAKKVKKGGEDKEVETTTVTEPTAETPATDEVVAESKLMKLKALIENKLNTSTAHPAKVDGKNVEQAKSKERGEVKGFAKAFQVIDTKEKEANTEEFEPKTNSNKLQDRNFKAKDSGKLEPKAKQVNEGYERLSRLIDKVIRERK